MPKDKFIALLPSTQLHFTRDCFNQALQTDCKPPKCFPKSRFTNSNPKHRLRAPWSPGAPHSTDAWRSSPPQSVCFYINLVTTWKTFMSFRISWQIIIPIVLLLEILYYRFSLLLSIQITKKNNNLSFFKKIFPHFVALPFV